MEENRGNIIFNNNVYSNLESGLFEECQEIMQDDNLQLDNILAQLSPEEAFPFLDSIISFLYKEVFFKYGYLERIYSSKDFRVIKYIELQNDVLSYDSKVLEEDLPLKIELANKCLENVLIIYKLLEEAEMYGKANATNEELNPLVGIFSEFKKYANLSLSDNNTIVFTFPRDPQKRNIIITLRNEILADNDLKYYCLLNDDEKKYYDDVELLNAFNIKSKMLGGFTFDVEKYASMKREVK